MDKYYHSTKYEYLDDISELGLIPKIGERSASVDDDKQVVFFSKGEISAVLMFFAMRWFYESHKGEAGEELLASSKAQIEYYDKLISKRQNKKSWFFAPNIEELKRNRDNAIAIKNRTENMKKYQSFEEYWGTGVYLCVDDVQGIKYNHPDIHNCWVENSILPESIKVVMLRNNETGELIDDKYKIVNYFMANISERDLFIEYSNTIGINDDKYTKHDTMTYFINYYSANQEEFNDLRANYELVELPIKEYASLKSIKNGIGEI